MSMKITDINKHIVVMIRHLYFGTSKVTNTDKQFVLSDKTIFLLYQLRDSYETD